MPLYAVTILISAFLLFQVEPVIAKIILPWFGGSAAVWTVCLLFFQLVLLLGYFYAHALIRYLQPRAQMLVHAGLLLVSLAALPIYPGPQWKPLGTEDPTARILILLAAKVGVPYFLLSTTGPLLQAWYARRFKGAMPYRLYALSNAGSMFALISYPVLFEPVYTSHQQALLWSIGYAVFIALCGYAAVRSGSGGFPDREELAAADVPAPGARQYLMWLALPACASLLLLAVTNHLSQNVAAIPFLWVLPLSIYLLSFILTFETRIYRRNPFLQLFAVALGSMAYGLGSDMESNPVIWVLVLLYPLGLLLCCMVLHGELVRLKPHPRYLTHFYLMIAAGGALGGILVGLVAPHVLHSFYELPIGLVASALVVTIVLKQDRDLTWFRRWIQPAPVAACILTLGLAVFVTLQIRESAKNTRLMARNFYGGLKVRDSGPATDFDATRSLTNGTIGHGEQFLNLARRHIPTTYYGLASGIGRAIQEKQKHGAIRVGVIGLGTGTIAAYGRWGDYYRYYEINPLVLRIATTQFSFLTDCNAKHDVAMGDARLSLEREAPENFDVLAVDAFSSDSIPVHLLTREAMQLYFRHLRPDGILAVHISNRYLDLEPVLEGEVTALGKTARVVSNGEDDLQDVFRATWVLIQTPPATFGDAIMKGSEPLKSKRKVRLWTDDYSNLFQIVD